MYTHYNKIGQGYNTTRKSDSFLTERFLHHLSPRSGGLYLDVGCGTGNYTRAFADKGLQFIGLDPSSQMLDTAKAISPTINWKEGSAEDIPLQNSSVDGATAILTTHHWTDITVGMREISRVLKPKGKLVVFTSTPEQMQTYWLNHYFPNMLAKSCAVMPSLKMHLDALQQAGFVDVEQEKYFVQADLQDLFLQSGKQRPELYLNENVRKGISSFAALSNAQEVQSGLAQLQQDIQSGHIEEVVKQFEGTLGDYLILYGTKG